MESLAAAAAFSEAGSSSATSHSSRKPCTTVRRRQVRAMKGIELLVAGRSVKTVAAEVGYRQPSAFVELSGRLLERHREHRLPRSRPEKSERGRNSGRCSVLQLCRTSNRRNDTTRILTIPDSSRTKLTLQIRERFLN